MQKLPTNAIAKSNQIFQGFEECPDYAITALWYEWRRVRRQKPPENMICTTGASYQAFCRMVTEMNQDGCTFPSVFLSRNIVDGWSYIPTWSSQAEDKHNALNVLEAWPEADTKTYIAFIYDGPQNKSIGEAIARLMQSQLRLGQSSEDQIG